MKQILLPALLLFSINLFSQSPDKLPRETRLLFYPLPDNAKIKSTGISYEKVYGFYTDARGKTDSFFLGENKYDANGFIISKTQFENAVPILEKYNYQFYNNGVQKELMIETSAPGFKNNYTKITYDEHGNEIYYIEFDEAHTRILTLRKDYNANGQCIHLWRLDGNNQYKLGETYSYEANGTLKSIEVYPIYGNGNGTMTKVNPGHIKTYSFKTNKDIETVDLFYMGSKSREASFTYSEEGPCLMETRNETTFTNSTRRSFNDDINVTISNGRPNAFPETYSVPAAGMAINNINLSQAVGGNTSLNAPGSGYSSVSIESTPGSSQTTSVNRYKVTRKYYFNENGLLAEDYINNEGNKTVISKKHYYFK